MGGVQILREIELDEKEDFSFEQIGKFKENLDDYQRFVKAIEKDTSGNFQLVREIWLPDSFDTS